MSSGSTKLLFGAICMKSIHLAPADTLVEDDRILLKDLRVLTVTRVVPTEDGLSIRYYELAAKEAGSLAVPKDQQVKILCGGRCYLSRQLDELL